MILRKKSFKTLWEKEKMLVTSIFSFSHNVFYPYRNKLQILVTFMVKSANAFNLDKANFLGFGKGLRLVQVKSIYRQQVKGGTNDIICHLEGKTTLWEKEQKLVTITFFAFSMMLSKASFPMVMRSRGCVEKG